MIKTKNFWFVGPDNGLLWPAANANGNAKIWGKKTFGLPVVGTFSDVEEGELLILNGSSDVLELAVNLGNAEDRFGLKLGQVYGQ